MNISAERDVLLYCARLVNRESDVLNSREALITAYCVLFKCLLLSDMEYCRQLVSSKLDETSQTGRLFLAAFSSNIVTPLFKN